MRRRLAWLALLAAVAVAASAPLVLRAADLQSFRITRSTDRNVSAHRFIVEARRVESRRNGAVLHDFTGDEAILLALRVEKVNLSDEEKRELVEMVAAWLIDRRAENGPPGLSAPP